MAGPIAIPTERIEQSILFIRGEKVLLDAQLAALYGVSAGRLNEAVKRNSSRFPLDFMFQLTPEEFAALKSQFAIAKKGRGGRRTPPYAFTEHGVAMLSSVLRTPTAIMVNIEVVRAFVRLRQLLSSNAELARRLTAVEAKYDSQFKVVFDAIRQLMLPPEAAKKKPVGFHSERSP